MRLRLASRELSSGSIVLVETAIHEKTACREKCSGIRKADRHAGNEARKPLLVCRDVHAHDQHLLVVGAVEHRAARWMRAAAGLSCGRAIYAGRGAGISRRYCIRSSGEN